MTNVSLSDPILVPVAELYIPAYRAQFEALGCKVKVVGHQTCSIELPPGSERIWQPHQEPDAPRFLIVLPDGTEIEEVSRRGGFSYLFPKGRNHDQAPSQAG